MDAFKVMMVVIFTAYAVWQILRQFGVFEFSGSSSKVVTDIKTNRKKSKKRKWEISKLNFYASVTSLFRGLLLSEQLRQDHIYYIQRLEIRSEALDRLYTPEELRGKYITPFIVSLAITPVALFYPILFLIPIACLFYFGTYLEGLRARIRDEDAIIDDYFINLYLTLYPKLKQGSRARLQPSIENYIDTLETRKNDEVNKVMLKLSRHFLNLLSLYEDHVAVPMLTEVYRSATIINFSNIATQALNGIANEDNLLSFKIQLVNRKLELMRVRSNKLVRAGERSIYAIYIILFIMIAVGWYSKLPTDFF